jgi:hypothetical protein
VREGAIQGPNATAVTDTPLKGEKVCRQVQLTSIEPRGLGLWSVFEECNGYKDGDSNCNSKRKSRSTATVTAIMTVAVIVILTGSRCSTPNQA